MPTLEDVYAKFGEASEAAQLLETELGTMLFLLQAIDNGIISGSSEGIEIEKDPTRAAEIANKINRSTLGNLIKKIQGLSESVDAIELLLGKALDERNRLQHHFFRQHNFRRNSDEGRALMLRDLEAIHIVILDAYKAVMKIGGIDLDTISLPGLPTEHVPI